tara:strand:+ start:9344 stop:13492 length:4149 start_codon:yes stop_codon:yes gene_type:complete
MSKVTVNKISTNTFESYTEQDLNLVPSFDVISQFTPVTDVVEFSIYNEQNLLEYISYDYIDYSVTLDYNTNTDSISTVNVDPQKDLIKNGYSQGNYTVVYNFLRNQLSSSLDSPFYIKEISSDRTEIRLANNNLTSDEIGEVVASFKEELNDSPYFEDFQINLGNNNIFIANNILLDSTSEVQNTVLIKLYEPLETQFIIKDTLWVTLQTAEAVSYNINFPLRESLPPPPKQLQGPNFEFNLKNEINTSTVFQNSTQLTTAILTSSYDELQGILEERGVKVNIDYSDFNNFVYFSSAEQRARNFYYKVGEIEAYNTEITTLDAAGTSQVSSSLTLLESKITRIIKNFDGYEKYQYYSSGSSNIYPKSNPTPPYTLQSTGSVESLSWLTEQATNTGSSYDFENPDRLVNTLPSFVKDQSSNASYFLFLDMVGQQFDTIWAYTKDIGNRWDADNRLDYGISKDLVADAIRSMGVSLYQNNFSSDGLYSAFVGVDGNGNLLPPTGSEVIETYITASSTITKLDDVNKETYKRIFHNLPYLLKKKGTVEGLRTLINTYGIPDTTLRISEFGGKDKDNSNDYDYFQDKFNYAWDLNQLDSSEANSNVSLQSSWDLNTDWGTGTRTTPSSVQFRFKAENTPPTNASQSLFLIPDNDAASINHGLLVALEYTGSGFTSSSYSGSIPSSSNDYGRLKLYVDSLNTPALAFTTDIYLPFFNGNWWSVMISSGSGQDGMENGYQIYAADKIYNGNDGFKINHIQSSSIANNGHLWGSNAAHPLGAYLGVSASVGGNYTHPGFSGSFQEYRFYNTQLSESAFRDYVMNPLSIEGNGIDSSPSQLAFRAPLGSELITSSLESIHPKITGSWDITQSFSANSNFTLSTRPGTYVVNREFIYYDQTPVGIKNRVSEKIRAVDNNLPTGSVLTPYISLQQNWVESSSYTEDVDYAEVAFSPQNEINDDINSSLGYFNIGEYIGDPSIISQSVDSYPLLDNLRDSYFEKYIAPYNWNDYTRLIKYFDNSLFKMVEDFTPVRSSLASGVVIKQTLLERNRQKPPDVETSLHDYTGSIESGFISGGAGGSFNSLNVLGSSPEGQSQGFINSIAPYVTQSWSTIIDSPVGPLAVTQSTQDEFYDGELSGSAFTVTDGDLNTTIPDSDVNLNLGSFISPWSDVLKNTGWASDPGQVQYNTIGLPGGTFPEFLVSFTFDGRDSASPSTMNPNKPTHYLFNYLPNFGAEFYNPGDDLIIRTIGGNNPAVYTFTVVSTEQGPGISGGGSTIVNISPVNLNLLGANDWTDESMTSIELINNAVLVNNTIYEANSNPIVNNVQDNRLSTIYQDVDYSGGIIPVNQLLLSTNSALKFPIPDSNYSQTAWKNGRYNGTRLSSPNFNVKS